MTQQLHTEDLARADAGREASTRDGAVGAEGDDVMVAELAEPQDGQAAGSTTAASHWAGLSDHDELRSRWEAIQAGFVDEPRRAVEDADALVAQVIRELAESFAAERNRLERQWSQGDQVSTEDLRVALQRYRAFFQDLLSH